MSSLELLSPPKYNSYFLHKCELNGQFKIFDTTICLNFSTKFPLFLSPLLAFSLIFTSLLFSLDPSKRGVRSLGPDVRHL